MYQQGTVRGSAVRAASLLALASAGLFSLTATASAAGPPVAIPADYSCSLAAYGQGLAPLNIPAALSADRTGLTVTVTLVTQPVQLPTAAASALPQLGYLDIAGTAAQANGMSGTAVKLSGQSGYLGTAAGSMTQLPAMTATGTASQTGQDPAAVQVPPALTLTPVGSASQARQAPLTCTTTSATTVQVITVQAAASAAGVAAASAPAAAPGAPDTGGGGSLHPGNDLPLAAAGAAAVLAGLAITLYTLRRRRGWNS